MNDHQDVATERVEWIRVQIRRYEASCGCELGLVFTIGSLLSYAGYVTLGPGRWSAWAAAVVVISCSVIGKLIGLAYAHLRLIGLRSQLADALVVKFGDEATGTHDISRLRNSNPLAESIKE
jgi:hypothetical protein